MSPPATYVYEALDNTSAGSEYCLCIPNAMFVCRYDSRVKAMELDERPTEEYSDIGGLDKQIEEVSLLTLSRLNSSLVTVLRKGLSLCCLNND